jgi:hypothetical protein
MTPIKMQTDILVDDEKYVVQLYSPTFGLTLYAKLVRLLGDPVTKLMRMVPRGTAPSALLEFEMGAGAFDTDAIGSAIQSLFINLREEDFAPLLKEILSETRLPTLDPVTSQFETRFAGRYVHLFKLVAKTLGVQYKDFLSGIVKQASVVSAAAASRVAPTAAPQTVN